MTISNGSYSTWRVVTNRDSQRSLLGIILFNIFISDVEMEAEVTLFTFSGDTTFRKRVKARAATQKDKEWLQ